MRRLIGGSAVFGIGWGSRGLVAPAAQLPRSAPARWEVFAFTAAMLAGIFAARYLQTPVAGPKPATSLIHPEETENVRQSREHEYPTPEVEPFFDPATTHDFLRRVKRHPISNSCADPSTASMDIDLFGRTAASHL